MHEFQGLYGRLDLLFFFYDKANEKKKKRQREKTMNDKIAEENYWIGSVTNHGEMKWGGSTILDK